MKPENLLVTTTGLTDYLTASALTAINAQRNGSGGAGGGGLGADDGMAHTMTNGDLTMRYEKDVSVIVKLADFGLARATASRPPYTEYVSTRWYRAPEVLLRSTEYGPPVDMWALGTILAEMLNLKPLFPGASEIDQVYRICETLGDPSPDYGIDERGRVVGGGPWNTGIKLAKNVGFSFPKVGQSWNLASLVRSPDAETETETETETDLPSAPHRTFVGCSTTKYLSRWSTVSPTCFVTTPSTDSPRRSASTTRTSTRRCRTCSTL
jgi:serine/threonine protein kinase